VPLTVKGIVFSRDCYRGRDQGPGFEAFVRLTRGKSTATIAFNKILTNPSENIYVRPTTSSLLSANRRRHGVRRNGKNASVPFDAAGISLEEALAKAGGSTIRLLTLQESSLKI